MHKPEWGIKRICQNCGAKFYDLRREPIVCPKCRTSYDPEAFLKTRRSRPPTGAEKEEAAPVLADEVELEDAEALEEDEAAVAVADEEDEDMIEDASELGEDEDDMAEVIDNVHGDEEP
jgi:uncharacterized protein (TIGR02300 family)